MSEHPTGTAIETFHFQAEQLEPHGEHSHTDHTLTYVNAGRIEVEHGVVTTATEGTISVVPAGVPHRLIGGSDLDIWGVTFCAACLGLDENQPLMRPFLRVRLGALPVLVLPEERRARFVQTFEHLDEETQAKDAHAAELAQSLLHLLLGEVCRAQAPSSAAVAGSLVSDALAVIQERAFEPISLRDVAAAVHRTPAHVAAQVKEATGHSVGQWITAARASEAATRLLHTDDSLDDVALHVGWQDKTHFIRQFKKIYGVTPAAWRRSARA